MHVLPRSVLIALSAFTLLLFTACAAPDVDEQSQAISPKLNKVIVLGMIHSAHETSEAYSTARVKGVMRAIAPDYVLTEIPPDRMDEAMRSFTEEGMVTEARVIRFPEYKDALFPLLNEMAFDIIPTAGWTRDMALFRRDALEAISQDKTRAEDWAAYQAGLTQMREAIGERGDDPYFIHTDEYDAITKRGYTPYATRFANDLGVGDWETINAAHYWYIERALDRLTGEGATILITYGAGHKYWFLEQLRARNDIELVSPLPYFDQVPADTDGT